MKIGTDREAHKLQTVINTNSDIVILIDHHLDQQKLAYLTRNNRQILSKFTIHGTPSLKRGILVLVKKSCGCKITNVQFFIIPGALEAMIQAIQAFSLTKSDQRRQIHAQISRSILT